MKTVVITQSNYIPWKGYFDQIRSADEFVLYDDAQYTKRDWRNRNKIKTAQGLTWLSVPVQVKGKFAQKIKDTRVLDRSWAQKHWKSIKFAYSKAKYFAEYQEPLEDLYQRAGQLEYLSEVNFLFISELCNWLGIKTNFSWSSDYELLDDKTERLAHICTQLSADRYLSGPAAKDYMREEVFAERGISVGYFDYAGYPTYEQLHGEFEHGITIIDLILNTGSEAAMYLNDSCIEESSESAVSSESGTVSASR